MTLEELGWTARWQQAFEPYASEGLTPGRVAAEHRGAYVVYTAEGECRAMLAGRLRHSAEGLAEFPAVGDWVALDATGDGNSVIRAVLPRVSRFARKVAGRTTEEQVLAANVDVVLLVTALGGDVNPRRLERYLTMAWESGATPVIALSKADLVEDAADEEGRVETVAIGVALHRVSALTGEGLDAIRSYASNGRTVALLGSSGVGKSTLVNALLGRERQRVAEVGLDGKGRHTTTYRELVPIPGGGLLLDTPGMRELQLWTTDTGVLDETFGDIAEFAQNCRFNVCQHDTEPECAVAAAVREGRLPRDRLEAFHKLRAEMQYLERRTDSFAARERKRQDRILNKAGQARIDEKYGN
ncbi:MAG: ribosome small subunit-dependent GTPase A [Longimicrobiales bacterium]